MGHNKFQGPVGCPDHPPHVCISSIVTISPGALRGQSAWVVAQEQDWHLPGSIAQGHGTQSYRPILELSPVGPEPQLGPVETSQGAAPAGELC